MVLKQLGPRICIMGPSNSGKSTLANVIARARGVDAIYLDQLYHLPNTNWLARPADEFTALHDAAIVGPQWVIEGNYSRLLPQRLERATGFILLDVPTVVSLFRYLRRCWIERDRPGALEGALDSAKWSVIRHIAGATRTNRSRYQHLFSEIDLPKVRLDSSKSVAEFYRLNSLSR